MVYIEEIIAIDVLIHLSFVYLTDIFCIERVRLFNLILSISINILLIFFYLYGYKNMLLTYGIILLISFSAFFKLNLKAMIREVFVYFSFNFLFGGLASVLYLSDRLKFWEILLLFILLNMIIIIYHLIYNGYFQLKGLLYKVILEEKNHKYVIRGYLDTGNFMLHNEIPILVLSKKYHIGKKVAVDEAYTISGNKTIELYKVDHVYVYSNKRYSERNAYIAYSKLHFDAMFGIKFLEG